MTKSNKKKIFKITDPKARDYQKELSYMKLSLDLIQGKSVVIVGKSGYGKTSYINNIMADIVKSYPSPPYYYAPIPDKKFPAKNYTIRSRIYREFNLQEIIKILERNAKLLEIRDNIESELCNSLRLAKKCGVDITEIQDDINSYYRYEKLANGQNSTQEHINNFKRIEHKIQRFLKREIKRKDISKLSRNTRRFAHAYTADLRKCIQINDCGDEFKKLGAKEKKDFAKLFNIARHAEVTIIFILQDFSQLPGANQDSGHVRIMCGPPARLEQGRLKKTGPLMKEINKLWNSDDDKYKFFKVIEHYEKSALYYNDDPEIQIKRHYSESQKRRWEKLYGNDKRDRS